jgi:hypothetical protein
MNHLTSKNIWDYYFKNLDKNEAKNFKQHLDLCKECREEYLSYKRIIDAIRTTWYESFYKLLKMRYKIYAINYKLKSEAKKSEQMQNKNKRDIIKEQKRKEKTQSMEHWDY